MVLNRVDVTHYPLPVVVTDITQQTKTYQGASRNEIKNLNTEDATFRSREITHTDWVHSCIAKDYLKTGDLYMNHNLPHHDHPTPDSAPYFGVSHVGARKSERCQMVQFIGDVCCCREKIYIPTKFTIF